MPQALEAGDPEGPNVGPGDLAPPTAPGEPVGERGSQQEARRLLGQLVPLVSGGLPALGSAAQGRCATTIGAAGLAATPAAKRAADAAACAARAAEMADR